MKRTLRLLTVLPFVIFLSNTIPTGFAQKLNFSVKTKAAGRPAPGGQVFGAAQTYASGFGGSTQSVAADLNGDGVPDLAILNPCNSSYCGSGYASVAVMIGNGDGSFQAPVLYATGSFQPMSLAAGDFNNDGAVDLVVASQCASSVNCGTGQVIVLLGNGDGTFQSPVPYSTGNGSSYFVVTADFNGDGNLDLAVANQTSGNSTLAIMLGNGDGTFQAPAAYSTGAASAVFLAVADFNMDGAADLVAANGGTADSVSVLLGNGDGTFQNPVIYPSGGAIANAAAVADFNGDGVPDLAVVNGCATYTNLSCSPNGSVGILLGNGDGTFQPPVAYGSAGNSPSSIAVADFNGDGNIDLAVANAAPPGGASGDGSLSLLLGNGAGNFQSAVTYDAGGTYSASISAADFNSDGQPDVAVVNQCPSMGACANGIDGVLLNAVSKPNLYASSTALSAAANPSGPTRRCCLRPRSAHLRVLPQAASLSTTVPPRYPQRLLRTDKLHTLRRFRRPPHALEAVYSGDGSHAGSASAVVRETVGALMALASSANPSILSNAVTFTAAVAGSGPLPTGAVTFMDGATTLGTVPLANGSAAIGSSSLAAGNHSITASYSGDSNYLPGAAALVQAVSQATTTAVSLSANPSSSNQPVVFTASVTAQSGVVNGGTVAFMQGSPPTTWGTAQVVNGQATLSNSFSRNNTYPITAAYLGSPAYQSSAATAINQVVSGSQTVSTSTTLQSSGSAFLCEPAGDVHRYGESIVRKYPRWRNGDFLQWDDYAGHGRDVRRRCCVHHGIPAARHQFDYRHLPRRQHVSNQHLACLYSGGEGHSHQHHPRLYLESLDLRPSRDVQRYGDAPNGVRHAHRQCYRQERRVFSRVHSTFQRKRFSDHLDAYRRVPLDHRQLQRRYQLRQQYGYAFTDGERCADRHHSYLHAQPVIIESGRDSHGDGHW